MKEKMINISAFYFYFAGPGSLIYKCLDHEQFYCYFPQLYPRKFCSLMKTLSGASINGLEEAICSEPWVFGYSNVNSINIYYIL